jgi:hypothetical protein
MDLSGAREYLLEYPRVPSSISSSLSSSTLEHPVVHGCAQRHMRASLSTPSIPTSRTVPVAASSTIPHGATCGSHAAMLSFRHERPSRGRADDEDALHGIPRGMVSRAAWYPARHGIPHGTVSRTARYPARHGIPHGTVSRTAWYPARHGIPHGTVSRTARYPARHGIPRGVCSACRRRGRADREPAASAQWADRRWPHVQRFTNRLETQRCYV